MTQALPQVGAPPGGVTFPDTPPGAATGPSVGAAPPALRPIVDRDKFNAAVAKVQTYAQENYGYPMPLEQAEALVQGDPNANLKMTVRIRTLAAQDQEQARRIQEAGLTGLWNGQPTLENRRVAVGEEQNKIEREKLAETARQFDTAELRMADQFAKTYGLSREEFLEVVRKNKAGETIDDARLKQAADQFDKDIALRRDTLQLSREQFQESTRQFNETFNAEADRFAQTIGLSRDQFLEQVRQYNSDRSQVLQEFVEKIRQFNQEMGLKKDELGLRREELEATREERQAAQARWEKEFDAQTSQFAQTFGLDEKKLEEGIRQFNTGQAFEDKKLEAQVTQFYEELGVTKDELQFRKDSFAQEYNQRAEQFAAQFGLSKEQFAEQVKEFEQGHQLANRELETKIAQFEDEMAERRENRLESMRQFDLTYQQHGEEFAKDLGMRQDVFLESVRQFNAGETLNYAKLKVDQATLDESIRQFNDKMQMEKEAQAWQDTRDEKDYLRKVYLTELEGTLQSSQQQQSQDWQSVEHYLDREHDKDMQDTRLSAEQRQTRETERYAVVGVALRGLAHFVNQKWLAADEAQKYISQLDAMVGNTAGWGDPKYWEGLGFGASSKGMAEHFQKYPAPKMSAVPKEQTPPGTTPDDTAKKDAETAGTAAAVDAALPGNQPGASAPGTNPDNLQMRQPAVGDADLLPGEQSGAPIKGDHVNTDPEIGLTGEVPEVPTGTVDWGRLKGTLTPRNLLTFGLQAVTGAYAAASNIAGMGSDPWVSTVTDIVGAGQAFIAGGGIGAMGQAAALGPGAATTFNPAGLAGYLAGRLAYGMYQWYGGGRKEFWDKSGYYLPAGYADNKVSPEIAQQLNLQQDGDRYLGVGAPFINFQKGEVVWTRSDGQGQAIESLEEFSKRANVVPISFYGAEDETWNSLPAELRQQLDFKPAYAVVNKDGSVLFMDRGGTAKGLKTKVVEPADAQKYFGAFVQDNSAPSPGSDTDDRGVNREQELRSQAKSVRGLSDVELDSITATLPQVKRTMLLTRLASGNPFTSVDEDSIFRGVDGKPLSASAWQAWTALKNQKRIPFALAKDVGG